MNDHDTFTDLDRRAASAAADLHERAASRPRPAFDPERLPSLPPDASAVGGWHRSRRFLAAAAALVLLLAGLAVWAGTRSDDRGPDPVGTDTTGGARPYVATDLPDGFTVYGAGEIGAVEGPPDGSAPLLVYGPSVSQPELGVTAFADFDLTGLDAEARPFRIGNVTAYVSERSPFGARTVVVPKGDHVVMALSPTLDPDRLGAIALAATGSGPDLRVPASALPTDWSQVATEPSLVSLANPVAISRGADGSRTSVVVYGKGAEASVQLASTDGDEGRLNAARLVLADVARADIGGHEAIVGSLALGAGSGPVGAATLVTWMERPGELIRVTGVGVDRETVVDLARRSRPAAVDEWQDLLERSRLGDFQLSGDFDEEQVEVARGRFDDGLAWVVRVGADAGPGATPDLTVALVGDSTSGSSGTGSTLSGEEPELGAMQGLTELEQGGRRFAAGFVGPEVETVEVRALDGSVLATAEVIVGSGDAAEWRVWVVELPDGAAWAAGRRGDGSEAGRQTITGGGATEDTVPEPAGPTTVASGTDSGVGGSGGN